MAVSKKASDQVRKKIEEAILVAEAERRRKLLGQRLSIARHGIESFQKHDMGAAIKSFLTYLKILEDAKGVPHGGLLPTHFDLKKDVSELLMISGIYWDLCKIYDRVAVDNREFQMFIQKYIQFSKGMPFQSVCAESLRKYISNYKPSHASDFKAAYKILGDARCFVATSLIDVIDQDTIPDLRKFRDEYLIKSNMGNKFITWYYRNGPKLADQIDQLPQGFRKSLGKILNTFALIIKKTTK